MAAFNPFYNEETGWTPLDELAPWQQALMNPGATNPGMSMPGYDQNLINQINGQGSVSNPGAGTGGGMMPSDPYTWTGSSGSAGNTNFNNVFNSGTTPRPSFNTPAIASPSLLANNMQMQGAQNVGGVGMYTGSNGPINSQLFNQQAGNMQPQLDYVRQMDQVSYYKYILPLQQAGLIDISNPQQVQAAVQQGLARDGGGQWSTGAPGTNASVSNVQGSPFSKFLQSGDPRAQAINQFMLSGDQNAIRAAQDWMGKNVRSDGTTANSLDNIDAWKQRFNSIYFPGGNFNSGSVSSSGSGPTPPLPGGGPGAPPPGGGGGVNNDWYNEFTAENPSQYTDYNKKLDNWAISQIDPNTYNRLKGKTDPESLNKLRQLLDGVRQQRGYQSWSSINQQATGDTNRAWLAEGYEQSPYAPTIDPGQFYKWNWGDIDSQDPNNPMSWYLQMNKPQDYQQLNQAIQFYNQNLKGKGLADVGNYGLYGEDGSLGAISEAMYGFMGNDPWQQYNRQVNDYLRGTLDSNSPFLKNNSYLTNNDMSMQFLQEMDNLRKQYGYMSNQGVQQLASSPGNLALNNFAGSPAGTPFRPNQNPGQGFKWSWMDSDGQGGAPGTWGQQIIGTPSSIQQATEYANYMNKNPFMQFNGSGFGDMFDAGEVTGGGFKYTPKTSYFQPKQTTPPPGGGGTGGGFDFSSFYSGNYTPQPSYPPSGGGGTGGGTGSGTPSGGSQNTGPWGGATFKPKFQNNYNMWS